MSAYALAVPQPKKLWSVPFKGGPACPVIYEGYVYAVGGANAMWGDNGQGRALSIELATGKTVWDEKLGPAEVSSLLIADGRLFVRTGKNVACYELSKP